MDWTSLIVILAFVTMIAAVGFAYVSKAKVDARRQSDARKSTLARDQSSTTTPVDV